MQLKSLSRFKRHITCPFEVGAVSKSNFLETKKRRSSAAKTLALGLVTAAIACLSPQSEAVAQQEFSQKVYCEGQYREGPAVIEGQYWAMANNITGDVARHSFKGNLTQGDRTISISESEINGNPVTLMFLNSGMLQIWERRGSELSAPYQIGTLFCRQR